MSILSFVNQDQLDELSDDPATAFMELVNHAQRSLHEQTKDLDEDERRELQRIEELRYSFTNVVLASAKKYEIEPFYSMEVPTRTKFDSRDFDQFKFDLEHYVTQLVLQNSINSKLDSVEILPKSKDSIRGYIHNLRECIEAASMGEKKREALLKRLDELEAELEKRRVSMMMVARIVYHLWAVPGSMWASYDVANKLLSNVMHQVAEAKEAENAQKLLSAATPTKALAAPRENQSLFRKSAPPAFDDPNDDVPF